MLVAYTNLAHCCWLKHYCSVGRWRSSGQARTLQNEAPSSCWVDCRSQQKKKNIQPATEYEQNFHMAQTHAANSWALNSLDRVEQTTTVHLTITVNAFVDVCAVCKWVSECRAIVTKWNVLCIFNFDQMQFTIWKLKRRHKYSATHTLNSIYSNYEKT